MVIQYEPRVSSTNQELQLVLHSCFGAKIVIGAGSLIVYCRQLVIASGAERSSYKARSLLYGLRVTPYGHFLLFYR